jgi:hypothetical protein
VNSTKPLKNNYNNFYKLIHKIEEEKLFPNYFPKLSLYSWDYSHAKNRKGHHQKTKAETFDSCELLFKKNQCNSNKPNPGIYKGEHTS